MDRQGAEESAASLITELPKAEVGKSVEEAASAAVTNGKVSPEEPQNPIEATKPAEENAAEPGKETPVDDVPKDEPKPSVEEPKLEEFKAPSEESKPVESVVEETTKEVRTEEVPPPLPSSNPPSSVMVFAESTKADALPANQVPLDTSNEPQSAPVSAPVVETIPEPVSESVVESIPDASVSSPVVKDIPEHISSAVVETIAKPVSVPTTETVKTPEPCVESKETISESVPIVESVVSTETAPSKEAVVETSPSTQQAPPSETLIADLPVAENALALEMSPATETVSVAESKTGDTAAEPEVAKVFEAASVIELPSSPVASPESTSDAHAQPKAAIGSIGKETPAGTQAESLPVSSDSLVKELVSLPPPEEPTSFPETPIPEPTFVASEPVGNADSLPDISTESLPSLPEPVSESLPEPMSLPPVESVPEPIASDSASETLPAPPASSTDLPKQPDAPEILPSSEPTQVQDSIAEKTLPVEAEVLTNGNANGLPTPAEHGVTTPSVADGPLKQVVTSTVAAAVAETATERKDAGDKPSEEKSPVAVEE